MSDRAWLFSLRGAEGKPDADHAPFAPNDLALPADDRVRNYREAELASDRGVEVSEKFRSVCRYVKNSAFMASNVILYRDPRRVLSGPAHQPATLLLDLWHSLSVPAFRKYFDIQEDVILFRSLTMLAAALGGDVASKEGSYPNRAGTHGRPIARVRPDWDRSL